MTIIASNATTPAPGNKLEKGIFSSLSTAGNRGNKKDESDCWGLGSHPQNVVHPIYITIYISFFL